MRIEEFGEEQARLARGFAAWWLTNHHFAIGADEEGVTADEMWPLDCGAGEYDEALLMFDEQNLIALEDEHFAHMLTLLPDQDGAVLRKARDEARADGPAGP